MKSLLSPRVLLIVGFVLMVAGAIDPLEGSVVILLGSVLAAIGGFLSHSRRRVMLGWALALIAVGVGLMFGMSAMGGIGGRTGRSLWWALVLLPYPVGWLLGLIAGWQALRRRQDPVPG